MFNLLAYMQKKKILPHISPTEKEALEAGSVWIDGKIFEGKVSSHYLTSQSYHQLSSEEDNFLNHECDELLSKIDPYKMRTNHEISSEVVNFLKNKGFFGLNISKKYGGQEFSTLGKSSVMTKISPYSITLGSMVIIPNSLGAGELIAHYGTQNQKSHYLPRLANGSYIPCFGLTEMYAGSDAASIRAEAEVIELSEVSKLTNKPRLGLKLNFSKRYITLAPVANLISLACRIKDPNHLLQKIYGSSALPLYNHTNHDQSEGDLGISVVLIHKFKNETDELLNRVDLSHNPLSGVTEGLEIGEHHLPIGEHFYNGPIRGHNVMVPLENVIGGLEQIGKGWNMLMEQLAGGRAISLPAGAVGGMKSTLFAAAAYASVRNQFGMSLNEMEGVGEKLAKIAGITYLFEAGRVFSCSAINDGEHPPVISGIMKEKSTEYAREVIKEGMDIMAGAGIMQGENNILGNGYSSAPVGVTVEGANILTRTLIIFGQGAIRCHPYALDVIHASEKNDSGTFNQTIFDWGMHFVGLIFKNFFHSITRGCLIATEGLHDETKRAFQKLSWASIKFAFLTNVAMFALGGKLKTKGRLTGSFADVLSFIFLGFASIRRYEESIKKSTNTPHELALLNYALAFCFNEIQREFERIHQGFGHGFMGWIFRNLRLPVLRLNAFSYGIPEIIIQDVVKACQSLEHIAPVYDGMYLNKGTNNPLQRLEEAFLMAPFIETVKEKIRQAMHNETLPKKYWHTFGIELMDKNVLNQEEFNKYLKYLEITGEIVQVDVVKKEDFFNFKKSTSKY